MPQGLVKLGPHLNMQYSDMQSVKNTHLGALQPASSEHDPPTAGWSMYSHPLPASEAGVASA